MWHSVAERPDVGKRIIAPYNDGSGAAMFLVADGCLVDPDGGEYPADYLEDHEAFGQWAYLPDGVTLWFEGREGGEP